MGGGGPPAWGVAHPPRQPLQKTAVHFPFFPLLLAH